MSARESNYKPVEVEGFDDITDETSKELCILIDDVVKKINIGVLKTHGKTPRGRKASYNRVLLKIVLKAYCEKIYTCNRIDEHTKKNLASFILAEGYTPSFTTISNFVKSADSVIKRAAERLNQKAVDEGFTIVELVVFEGEDTKIHESIIDSIDEDVFEILNNLEEFLGEFYIINDKEKRHHYIRIMIFNKMNKSYDEKTVDTVIRCIDSLLNPLTELETEEQLRILELRPGLYKNSSKK